MRAALTIDVDPLRFYGAIHGLEGVDPTDDPIYAVGLPRFFELLAEVGAPGTVFFVGEDVPRAERLLADGLRSTRSELASHSHVHDYRMSRRPASAIAADLALAHAALTRVAPDGRVVGFRAPGYNTTPALLEAVLALGYRYDSSLLPAPLYFCARAAAIVRYALARRPSASLIGDLRAFWGPLEPYRAHPRAPWRPATDGPLVELPMAVDAATRLPLIGTSWVLFPPRWREAFLRRALRRGRCFVFEMHAIDLVDGTDVGVPRALAEVQPDLRRPAREKIEAFRSLFRALKAAADVATLADLAESIRSFPEHGPVSRD